MRCECEGCKNHDSRCLNHEGQLDLFSEQIIEIYFILDRGLCQHCTPKPIAKPSNLHPCVKESERLSKQPGLFLFL